MRRALGAVRVLFICRVTTTFNLLPPLRSSLRSSSPSRVGAESRTRDITARARRIVRPQCSHASPPKPNERSTAGSASLPTPPKVSRESFVVTTLGAAGAAALAWGAVAGSSSAAPSNKGIKTTKKTAVLGEVEKSPNDPRSYRAIQLPSGLRVLLISDPETKTAAAAMDVHVGHFSDPDDLPGLAHFCEHLLFLGTDKYPDETSYSTYLSSHGGSSNAYTDTEDTVYFFDVGSDHLEGALDRFAQFFIAPQFTESATGRELNSIESEDAKNQISDTFRDYQLEKSRANTFHPYSKFGTGNKKTLLGDPSAGGRSARQALLQFFNAYYSANQMTLVVLGKESLSQLQSAVDTYFLAVPNRGSGRKPSEQWLGRVKPFPSNQPPCAYDIVPVKDLRSLRVSWPISFESDEERKELLSSKPFTYIGSLLGHEGPGSLLSYLKKKNWANGLGVDSSTFTDDFTIFEVEVALTPEGLANRSKVLTALFSYLDLIRREGPPPFLASELQALSDLGWRFQNKREPGRLVPQLVANMQQYDTEKAISGPVRLERYNETLVNRLLEVLKPEPVDYSAATPLFTVIAKDFEKSATEKEKWYGTPYQIENLDTQVRDWSSPRAIPELKLPGPNPFIPQMLSVIVPRGKILKAGEKVEPPKVVENLPDAGMWRVRHKLDDVFAQPKAICYFELVSPVAYESPRTAAALKLFELSLDERLNEYVYDAQMAGLGYSLYFTTRGVCLLFSGYNDKMPDFITKIAEALATHAPTDPVEFERLRDVVRRNLSSYDIKQPYMHAMTNAALAIEDPRFSVKEIRDSLDSVKMTDVKPLVFRVFEEAEGISLIQGNLRADDVPRYLEGVCRSLKPAPLPVTKRPETTIVKFPLTPSGCGSLIRKPEENRSNENSASQLIFQVPDRSIESRVLAQLLMAIIDDPYYDSLRTQQQLGYLVFSGVNSVEGISLMFFIVQSPERDPSYLTERSLEFLKGFRQQLVDLPASKLSDYAGGLIDRKLEPDHRLSSEVERHWSEITTGQLDFDSRRKEADALQRVRPEDILGFFDRHILEGGAERRVLTSEVFASKHAEDMGTTAEGAALVADAKEWKSRQEKFPIRPRHS